MYRFSHSIGDSNSWRIGNQGTVLDLAIVGRESTSEEMAKNVLCFGHGSPTGC
jgi:hypothetical protein